MLQVVGILTLSTLRMKNVGMESLIAIRRSGVCCVGMSMSDTSDRKIELPDHKMDSNTYTGALLVATKTNPSWDERMDSHSVITVWH
jgi:hypothetical protein